MILLLQIAGTSAVLVGTFLFGVLVLLPGLGVWLAGRWFLEAAGIG